MLKDRHTQLAIAMVFALSVLLGACAGPQATVNSRYVVSNPQELMLTCREGDNPKQWAVIVGVNDYKDEAIADLEGAVPDAWAFYHYLTSPDGGRVPIERVQLLLNGDATRRAVIGALGNFLKHACPQDQVIIYFAGHGAPEPESTNDAFLLLHDTEVKNLVASAISMNKLPDFLEWRAGRAGQLLMLVDACHSGVIKFPGKRGADLKTRLTLVQDNLTRLADTKQGWGAISAAASDEYAQEKIGGWSTCTFKGIPYSGGLFTCHLLSGLSGAADNDKNGAITVDELVSHLKTNVYRDSRKMQLPQLSGTLEGTTRIARPGTKDIAIPHVPELYLGKVEETNLRPWLWLGAGLSAAALGAGAGLNLHVINRQTDINRGREGIGDDEAAAQAEVDDLFTLAVVFYSVGAALGALSAAGWAMELLDEPEGIEEVYERPPWIELGLDPSGEAMSLKLNWSW